MFYKRLQQLCIEKGVSMQKVAADIGISPAAISKWSKGGKPNNANAKALAEYFGTSVAGLLEADAGVSLPSQVTPAQNLADAYAGLRKDYDDFRAIVQSQQATIQTLSNSNWNWSESTKNLSVTSKNISEASNKLADANKNFSISSIKLADANKNFSISSIKLAESTKNLSASNKNLSESIKCLATNGSLSKSR